MRGTMRVLILLFLCCLWAGTTPRPASAGEPTVLVVPQAEMEQYWSEIRRGALDAGAKRGANILYRGPMTREEYHSQQADIVEAADSVDAIVIAPSDADGVSGALDRARRRGIPVVVIDSALEGSGYSSFIGTDNKAAGRMAAGFLLDRLPADAPILLLRHLEGTYSTMEREQGFVAAVADRGRKDALLVSEYIGISRGNAYRRIMALLLEHPEVRGVFAPAETVTGACIKALRELGLADAVAAVGFDVTPESRLALRDGVLDALVVQQPYRMGYLGVAAACDILEGKTVPRRVVTDVRLVTDPGELRPNGD